MRSTLKTFTVCQYLTDTATEWRPEDWTAYKMVKALKGDDVKGYFDVKIGGSNYRFDNSNKDKFVELIPSALAKIVNDEFSYDVAIVPIPNSTVTDISSNDFKTLNLAIHTCAKAKGNHSPEPLLVFREPQIPSRKGGRRSPEYFESAYKLIRKVDKPIVLLDDVCTTGAHFIGATWKLQANGMNVIGAVAFGRSTKQQFENAISRRTEELDITKVVSDFDF